ncbi:hypothetical protein QTP86_001132 [Hemibagrus guttatus]|nr:hypothetical protein QTP86_001132 [Hemibagrus guttatus]
MGLQVGPLCTPDWAFLDLGLPVSSLKLFGSIVLYIPQTITQYITDNLWNICIVCSIVFGFLVFNPDCLLLATDYSPAKTCQKAEKCEFHKDSITFLGYIISQQGVAMDQKARWALCFTRFQFTDMYCLGMKSGKTDALSWQHDPTSAPAQPKPILPPSACSDLVGPQGGDTVGQVNVSLSSEYHPQFNGQTERLNQEIGRYLQCWTTSFPWSGEPSDVPVVDDWIRHSREVWESAHIHLQRAIQRQQIQADRQRCPHPRFQLPPLYRISPTFNVSLPKLAHPHQDDATIRDEPPPPLDIDRVPAYRKDTELLVPGALAASFSATTEGTLPVEVSKAKQKAYDELYTRLDTREGEKDLYRLARQRDRDGKDVQQVRVIKDRDGRVLTSEESVQRRWKEYFEELMNEENEREKRVEGVNSVEQKVDKMRKDEVRKTLKRMKSGKAVGPDDIPVEVWKCLGEAAVEFLTSLFNRVLKSERMPEEWR